MQWGPVLRANDVEGFMFLAAERSYQEAVEKRYSKKKAFPRSLRPGSVLSPV